MPELPEVETVRRGLAPDLENARILGVELRRPDLRRPLPDGLADRLKGREIQSVGRRAKYLLVHLDDGNILVSHLGMTGSFRLETVASEGHEAKAPIAMDAFHMPRGKLSKHDHIILRLRPGADRAAATGATEPFWLIYNDPRRFGSMDLVDGRVIEDHPLFAHLGPEPNGNSFSAEIMAPRFSSRKGPLKSVLLDQAVVAGLGNIYVCEALWRAGLSPRRRASSLVTSKGAAGGRLDDLTAAIRQVIDDAIAAGGSTLKDYRQADGSLGYFQHTFAVYDRAGENCLRPTCDGTIRRIVQSGRSTFYCSRCQR